MARLRTFTSCALRVFIKKITVIAKDNTVEESSSLVLYCEPSLYYPIDFATTIVEKKKKIDIVSWNFCLL